VKAKFLYMSWNIYNSSLLIEANSGEKLKLKITFKAD
jgi:hypothetical protein